MSKILYSPVGDSLTSDFANLDPVTWSGPIYNNLPLPTGSGFWVTLNAATIFIRGITAAPHGTMLLIYHGAIVAGVWNIRFQHLHASGTVGNKLVLASSGSDVTLLRYRNIYLRYNETLDSGNGAWDVLSG